jgi:hypothetical protein
MNGEAQKSAEQALRDQIDYLIDADFESDKREVGEHKWCYRNSTENHNKAPFQCFPNQTLVEGRDGAQYLVTVTMLKPPRGHRR